MLVCSWLALCFLSRGFQVGVYFLALCFRGFSPCVLVCYLRTWVSSIVLIAWSTDIYVYIVKINGMYYLQIFRDWGLLVLCVVVDSFCLNAAFTSGRGECLDTTGLCFGHLFTMSLSVLYGGLHKLRFRILCWV